MISTKDGLNQLSNTLIWSSSHETHVSDQSLKAFDL